MYSSSDCSNSRHPSSAGVCEPKKWRKAGWTVSSLKSRYVCVTFFYLWCKSTPSFFMAFLEYVSSHFLVVFICVCASLFSTECSESFSTCWTHVKFTTFPMEVLLQGTVHFHHYNFTLEFLHSNDATTCHTNTHCHPWSTWDRLHIQTYNTQT